MSGIWRKNKIIERILKGGHDWGLNEKKWIFWNDPRRMAQFSVEKWGFGTRLADIKVIFQASFLHFYCIVVQCFV